ncbi:Carbon monoxide dehydrogenase medium chain [Hartmannibacter diazotrophicus]|uniref:Carbon monoxide dehydrogenase medium chain n=1 Tax=Hartmannibacter diazotrophicus TaxID=1482074 RepID=A0A2C9D1S9_9HYPH|nr:xanthine dehydrogenase family protein subunit M [Hartmannibacter diazotrophicus]SON54173.1 Carbon monoxide dehydrogenase medium chain [Hartmannibacter diazotrophicus]
MYETSYTRPTSLSEAVSILASDDEAKLLAGGQTLIPTMKQRLAAPSKLIDLARLAELKGISVSGDTVTIGAGTTHYEVASSSDVAGAIPALARLASGIGDPQVRYRGTLGGSVANNDPAADYPAAVLGLGATVTTSKRGIPADEFFDGMFATALEEDEILVKISFPVPAKAAYAKFANPASRYAMAGVFVAKMKDGSVRVAVTGAGQNGVFRVPAMESALASNWSPDAVAGIKVDAGDLLSDIHGDATYRANLVTVMAKRAVAAAG